MIAQYIKDIATALKRELIRCRAAAAALSTVVFLAAIYLSLRWPQYYIAEVTIINEVASAIEPSSPNAAQSSTAADDHENIQDVVFSRQFLDRVLLHIRSGMAQLSPENVESEIGELRRSIQIGSEPGNQTVTRLSIKSSTANQAAQTREAVVDVLHEIRMEKKQKLESEAQIS